MLASVSIDSNQCRRHRIVSRLPPSEKKGVNLLNGSSLASMPRITQNDVSLFIY